MTNIGCLGPSEKCPPSASVGYQMSANWKKWPSAIKTKFVCKVATWINGQMQLVAKWILSQVD